MASRSRGQQRKKNRFIPDSDDEEEDIGIKLKSAQRRTASVQNVRAASKLSFGDEEEDAIVIKKKKKNPKARGISVHALEDNTTEQTEGVYSAQGLEQLKLTTPQMPQTFTGGKGFTGTANEGAISFWSSAC
jgi:hypothetical protein